MKYHDLNSAVVKLAQYPPEFAVSSAREERLLAIDRLLSEADSERSAVLGRFYRRRVDQALAEIAAYNGDTPRLWKFYSSGTIIKDRFRTIVVDLNRGCVPSTDGRTRLLMSDRQIRKIADLADACFCTHSHADHLFPELCDLMARKKKVIVMPEEAIKRWSLDGATPAEEYKAENCHIYLNWQGNADGGLDCAMYLFTLSNGKKFFVRGDIYHKEGFEGSLAAIRQWREKIDYAAITAYYTSGDAPVEILDREFACRFIPIHEWEFGHRPIGSAGQATQNYAELLRQFALPYGKNRAQMLFWGESIALD